MSHLQKDLMKKQEASLQKPIWKPIVEISEQAIHQAQYLCKKISSDEWVAAIMYTFTGSWENKDLEIEVVDIYPLHHAHGMAFAGKYDFDYNYAIDKGYELDEFRIGLLHSHCNAGVFFSGPDMEELKENAKHHPFYISLITNNKGEWCGKICIEKSSEITETGTATFRNTFGDVVTKKIHNKKTVNDYVIFDCDVWFSLPQVDDVFSSRVSEIIEDKKKIDAAKAVVKYNPNKSQHYSYDDIYNDAFKPKVWEQEIGWFFSTVDMTLDQIANVGHYTSETYGPDVLLQFLENCKFAISDKLAKDIIAAVVDKFKGYNTSFSKDLIKEYNGYVAEFLTSTV